MRLLVIEVVCLTMFDKARRESWGIYPERIWKVYRVLGVSRNGRFIQVNDKVCQDLKIRKVNRLQNRHLQWFLSVTPPRSCWHPWSLIHSYIAMFQTLIAKCRLAKHQSSPHESFRHKFLAWLSFATTSSPSSAHGWSHHHHRPPLLPALAQQFWQNEPGRNGQCCNLQLIICLSFSMEKHGRWRWRCLPLRRWNNDPKQICVSTKIWPKPSKTEKLILKTEKKVTAVDTVSMFFQKGNHQHTKIIQTIHTLPDTNSKFAPGNGLFRNTHLFFLWGAHFQVRSCC